jgi:enterochelin esterase family protein
LDDRNIDDSIYRKARRVRVYTPPAYDTNRKSPYPLLVFFDGEQYFADIPLTTILDNLIAAKKIPPVIALLVDDSSGADRLADLANCQNFAKFVGDELIPWAQKNWNITHDPHRAIISGSSAGGLGAAYVALQRPDLFGNVLSQSGAFWRSAEASNDAPFEWLTGQVKASPKKPVKFYLEVGAEEKQPSSWRPVFIDANRRFRDALLAKGYTVSYTEVSGAQHEPKHWSNQLPEGLLYLTSDWPR